MVFHWSLSDSKSPQVSSILAVLSNVVIWIIIIIIIIIIVFSHQLTPMVFHWSLSDSKSPQVPRTLLSILAVLNNALVWMVYTRPATSKSSGPFKNPKAPITIGIIVTFMFHNFFQFFGKVEVLILLFTFFQFYSVVNRDSKVDNFSDSLLFLLIIIRSSLLAEMCVIF